MSLTQQEVKEYVRDALGWPTVEVELEDNHYKRAYQKIFRVLAMNRAPEIRLTIPLAANQRSYTLTAGTWGYGVIDVEIPPPSDVPDLGFDVFQPRIVGIGGFTDLAEFELASIYAETARKVFSAEFEWEFNPETGVLLFDSPPTVSASAVVVCLREPASDDIRDPWLKNWALEFALAFCKMTLGHIRRKISSVEGTELTFELDGAELVNEGKEEMREMMEELKTKTGDFVPPVWGGGTG